MSDTLTVTQLITKVRERADMLNSQFVTDTEITGYIDYSYKELYDLLVESVEDYNLSSASFTIASGSNTYSLPSDFYKLRGLDDLTNPSRPRSVRKFAFNERNDFTVDGLTLSSYEYSDVTYRVTGSVLTLMPPENAAKNYLLWYVPKASTLSSGSDTADGVQGWLEYVIVDAAIKCKIKEESDISDLERAKKNLNERIVRLRHNRDQALPEKVSRVRNRRRTDLYPYVGDYYP